MNKSTLEVTANVLHTAIHKGDQSAVSRILTPLLSSDKHNLEQIYQTEFGHGGSGSTLQADLRSHFSKTDFLRDQSILSSKDGMTNNGGQISVALSELDKGNKKADVELREILQTLNSKQIGQVSLDYKSQNKGANFVDAIKNDVNVSAATKAALSILITGSDHRTAMDDVHLANLAVQYKDVNLLGEALRGDIQSPADARAQLLKDQDFQVRFNQAFGKNPIAKDFLKDGHISLSTIADANNAGFFWRSKFGQS